MSKADMLLSLKISFFILANCAASDEMPPYAAFHLGLHCLPKYLLTGIQNENGEAEKAYIMCNSR